VTGAREQYRAALQLNPRLASVHFNLAILLVNESRIAEARIELRAALDIDPSYAPARDLETRLRESR